jgi:hypothetical protein
MRGSRPPLIAAWILDRFGSDPETEAIAGDLVERYRQRRSRLWYWREVTVAILRGIWSEFRQHTLLVLIAIAMGWILAFVWHWLLTPFQYSLIVRYVLGHQARPQEIEFVGFLIEAPLAIAMGWTAARLALRCRIAAVLGIAASGLLVGCWTIWETSRYSPWPESLGYHFNVWPTLWPLPLLTALVLFGGGLLTGSPKRSRRMQ